MGVKSYSYELTFCNTYYCNGALHELIYKHTHSSAHTYTYIYRQFFTTVYFQRNQTLANFVLKKKNLRSEYFNSDIEEKPR